ncbi:conserved exported hypothetical protein [Burkholderia sp. 8Y]|uniref:hypothetical protein n=1 Tax=Burkholderia sp. 8Y TaxID=2653133 RepID=UPI0012F1B77E|nr:hypothetical protein [Burkholderia sp. 8Y]VXB79657.1 conserved exported hypothetical protein [Burkholderia sp. 8Y]
MRKKISTYWPFAVLLLAALTVCMHAQERESAARHKQTGVASVSAELARAISYGLVDSDEAVPAVGPASRAL